MAQFTIKNGELIKTVLTEDATFLEIPNNVTSIANFGLDISSNINKYNESVTRIILPSSITSCSLKAFKGFVNLQEIEIKGDSPLFVVYNNMLLSKDTNNIFIALKNISGSLKIDWTLQVKIADNAFEYCKKLTKIDLSNVIVYLGDFCFYHCENLQEIELPKSMQNFELGYGLFSDCYKLKLLCIPKNISCIPAYFAQNCRELKYVKILDESNKLEKISKYAFVNCKKLTDFTCNKDKYPNFIAKSNLTTIEEGSFNNCKSLSEATLFAKRIDIANDAFDGCDNACFFCYENSDVETFLIKKNFRYYHIEE